MTYNVQPLRTQQEINDFLFCLRRNKNAKRDVFLFLIGINSGLRMSDIVKLKKKDIISSKNPRIIEQKTGKTRILYLSSLQDLIQEYTVDLNIDDYLFPSTLFFCFRFFKNSYIRNFHFFMTSVIIRINCFLLSIRFGD